MAHKSNDYLFLLFHPYLLISNAHGIPTPGQRGNSCAEYWRIRTVPRIWQEELRKQRVFTEQLVWTKQEGEAGGSLGHVLTLWPPRRVLGRSYRKPQASTMHVEECSDQVWLLRNTHFWRFRREPRVGAQRKPKHSKGDRTEAWAKKAEWEEGEQFKTKQSKSQEEGENIERLTPLFAHNWAYWDMVTLIVLNEYWSFKNTNYFIRLEIKNS